MTDKSKPILNGISNPFSSVKSLVTSASNSTNDLMAKNPNIASTSLENKLNIETEIVSTMNCRILVSCAVGKEIRQKLKDQLKTSSDNYVNTLKNIKTPADNLNELFGFSTKITEKTSEVKLAQQKYEKDMKNIIKFNPMLKCEIQVTNAVDTSGNPVTNIIGNILEIHPGNKTLYVIGTAFKKISTGTKEVEIKGNVNISELCIGNSTSTLPELKNCFETHTASQLPQVQHNISQHENMSSSDIFINNEKEQSGGKINKRNSYADNLDTSSDIGICE